MTEAADAVERGLRYLERFQTERGSLHGDYDGPQFLLPGYVFARYATGSLRRGETSDRLAATIAAAQNPDGGLGLHHEGESRLFTTVLNYVALRLLGAPAEEPAAVRARDWIRARGGAIAVPTWGKCWLALLRLYRWEGVNPILPELLLLPRAFPAHPGRFWCHARAVYLPLAYLYGRRWQVPEEPLLAELRREIFAPRRFEEIDFRREARNAVAASDAYTPHSWLLRVANAALGRIEPAIPRGLRERALAEALAQVEYAHRTTGFLEIGPVSKALGAVVLHAAGSPESTRALERLDDYLFDCERGLTMQAYNSSELWDTAFAAQALVAGGRVDSFRAFAERAHAFVVDAQVLDDPPSARRYHRGPARGGWPFSTLEHGWPIADCTAEGLEAALALGAALGRPFPRERVAAATDFLLRLQNPDGGWPTYERRRGGDWLELLNTSELFADIMVDHSYVELTASAICGLVRAREVVADERIARALERGEAFLRSRQRADGSWEGAWGICFTYGTWFGVRGLSALGATADDPALRAATGFLVAKQLDDGGWGESYESCLRREYVHHPDGGQPVMTAWALLALLAAGAPGAHEAVERGLRFLLDRQLEDGDWPQRSPTGVFNRTCMLNYRLYRNTFPVWALAAAAATRPREPK
jgi:squalene/oxidosqualene cyclase-like protein